MFDLLTTKKFISRKTNRHLKFKCRTLRNFNRVILNSILNINAIKSYFKIFMNLLQNTFYLSLNGRYWFHEIIRSLFFFLRIPTFHDSLNQKKTIFCIFSTLLFLCSEPHQLAYDLSLNKSSILQYILGF